MFPRFNYAVGQPDSMFAKEGYALIAGSAFIALVLGGLGWRYGGPIGIIMMIFGVLVLGFTLYFFRDPTRIIPSVPSNTIMSPADGKVLLIDEIEEPLYFHGPALKISIFLSPLNVHVNRIPTDGVIEYDEYVSGEYLVAWHEKASELNERSQLGLMHPSGHKVLFKQIAGAVARRIVYHVSVGDSVKLGERFGIVKFGSRMDVIIPRGSQISVAIGDKVTGGQTILGYLPEPVN
ncbi:MAG: phosphatidylserine decarboxylase family protein [Bacteroidetes bacterium]|nr:phosphatidylserine decarboxylase family protein [Bacteroidota bacterium]